LVDSKLPSATYRRTERKLRPNEPCPCGSGIKYKKCCGRP
jgi:preprotein translocase subunit SecA